MAEIDLEVLKDTIEFVEMAINMIRNDAGDDTWGQEVLKNLEQIQQLK